MRIFVPEQGDAVKAWNVTSETCTRHSTGIDQHHYEFCVDMQCYGAWANWFWIFQWRMRAERMHQKQPQNRLLMSFILIRLPVVRL